MKQSSMEWLVNQFELTIGKSIINVMEGEIQQAKEMHEKEIKEAYDEGYTNGYTDGECDGYNDGQMYINGDDL